VRCKLARDVQEAVRAACLANDLWGLQCWYDGVADAAQAWAKRLPEKAMFYAAKDGRLNAVQWLMTHSCNPWLAIQEGLRGACVGNHLHVGKWLHAHEYSGDGDFFALASAFATACGHGHFAIARWFMLQHPDRSWPQECLRRLQTWSAPRDTWMRAVVCAAIH
jgi:hypothetical protein